MLTVKTIQAALDAEIENKFGYIKYDYKNKRIINSRNGYPAKTVQGSMGEMVLQISHDRDSGFEPHLVKKH